MQQVKTPEKFADGVYNVGGGAKNSFSLKELTKYCEKLTGKKVIISPEPVQRYADIPVFVTDFAKITATNQYKVKFCVEDVLLDVYNWIQENKSVCNV
jgi:CDP-paratose 2-epimerase